MTESRDRPLGRELDWTPVERPARVPLRGSHVMLRPISPADADALFTVSHPPGGDREIWTYLPDGPYDSPEDTPEFGVIEIGHIWLGVPLQRLEDLRPR